MKTKKLGILSFLLCSVFLSACNSLTKPFFSITNQSDKVYSGIITVSGSKYKIDTLSIGATKKYWYKLQRDSSVKMTLDGKTEDLNYYIGGMNNNFAITVDKNGASIKAD